jgi:Zn-dependent M32 family carboxypeptidase
MSLLEIVEKLIAECERHNEEYKHMTPEEFLRRAREKLEECKLLWLDARRRGDASK